MDGTGFSTFRIRTHSILVDVTNYVLMELGQLMHAFDLAKIEGTVHVRQAQPQEKLQLLNDQEVELQDDVMVIADDQKALAIAGIMGGLASSVTDDTTDIFLESAFLLRLRLLDVLVALVYIQILHNVMNAV